MRFSGKVLKNNVTVADQVTGNIQKQMLGGVERWSGHINVVNFSLEISGTYKLVLNDGRSGDIWIKRSVGSSQLEFVFSGAFQ